MGWWTKDKRRYACLIGRKLSPRVRTIISTSHRRKGCLKLEERFRRIFKKWKIAAEVAPDWTIHYGVRSTLPMMFLKKLEEKSIPRLAETRFALIELHGERLTRRFMPLDRLLHLGVTPVVAHIERQCLEKNEEARARDDWHGLPHADQ